MPCQKQPRPGILPHQPLIAAFASFAQPGRRAFDANV
jgi:hypothetical protein